MVGFLATFLLGLLLGIAALVVVGLIIYFSMDKSKPNLTNYFLFGAIAAFITFLVLFLLSL